MPEPAPRPARLLYTCQIIAPSHPRASPGDNESRKAPRASPPSSRGNRGTSLMLVKAPHIRSGRQPAEHRRCRPEGTEGPCWCCSRPLTSVQQFQTWPVAAPSCILPRTRGRTWCAAWLPPSPCRRGEGRGEGLGGARAHRRVHRSASAAQACGCRPKALPWAQSAPRRAAALRRVPCPRSMAGCGESADSCMLDPGLAASPTPHHPYLELLHSSDSRSACWGGPRACAHRP
jgi:hypothetical protein